MSTKTDLVPKWVRILVGILALANIIFGVMGYFDYNVLFHHGTDGVSEMLLKNASFEFSARNLAIGLALGIVYLKGVPESIAIVMIIRALVEFQSFLIGATTSGFSMDLIMPLLFFAVEIFIIKTIVGVIKVRDSD